MGAFTHWSQPNRGKELQDGTKNLEGNNAQGARGKNRKANNVAGACTKAKGRAAIECVVSIIHSICWHLPPKWLRKIIHNSITLFEIIICFQLFVCQVESVFLASFIRSQLTTPCCFFLLLDRNNMLPQGFAGGQIKHCQRHNGPEGWVKITSSYTNLDHISSSQSRPSIKL